MRAAMTLTLHPRDDERRQGRRVWIVSHDGTTVGIVGDVLPWRGSRFGALRWWSAIRDVTHSTAPATWSTGERYLPTRKAALTELLKQLEEQEPR